MRKIVRIRRALTERGGTRMDLTFGPIDADNRYHIVAGFRELLGAAT